MHDVEPMYPFGRGAERRTIRSTESVGGVLRSYRSNVRPEPRHRPRSPDPLSRHCRWQPGCRLQQVTDLLSDGHEVLVTGSHQYDGGSAEAVALATVFLELLIT